MDKKNTVIGVLLLLAAFTLMVFQQNQQPPQAVEGQAEPAATAADSPAETPSATPEPEPVEPTPEAAVVAPDETVPAVEVEEQIVTLENGYFRVDFTNIGGAVKQVTLKDYEQTKGSKERYVLNDDGQFPALGLMDFPGAGATSGYRLVSQNPTEVVYSATVGDDLEVIRRYSIALEAERHDPAAYLITHETEFRNLSGQAILLPEFRVHLGTATPIGRQRVGMQHLNFSYYDGEDFEYVAANKFKGGGFKSWIGLASGEPRDVIAEQHPIVWAAVKNQFFTSIYTPEQPASGFLARPVDFESDAAEEGDTDDIQGMTGSIGFDDLRGIPANGVEELSGTLYAGPKEFRRLEALGQEQDLVMQFGWRPIAFISKLLLSMMVGIHAFVPNYGLAIIFVTVIIKTLLWPLTATAARSSKRMAKIQEPMKALREKYKDDPKKMQMETMKLFKENKVNPVGGCLPMLIQIPIFFGLFRMIMSASELRFAEFLWVGDLSAPDTVAQVFGLPLNILPLFMGVTMFYQMRMMPMAMDNAQQKIFRFMPLIFFVFCYNFSSGLVLYWTVQNLLTILQQYLTNRKSDGETPSAAVAEGAGDDGGSAPLSASPYLNKGKGKASKAKKKKQQ